MVSRATIFKRVVPAIALAATWTILAMGFVALAKAMPPVCEHMHASSMSQVLLRTLLITLSSIFMAAGGLVLYRVVQIISHLGVRHRSPNPGKHRYQNGYRDWKIDEWLFGDMEDIELDAEEAGLLNKNGVVDFCDSAPKVCVG